MVARGECVKRSSFKEEILKHFYIIMGMTLVIKNEFHDKS